ncbi:MAG: AraC family transcriptional regulator [Pseudomonadaceae bacterium]|nr:AraC family transcriptional regulator [Pseudomonadaceae bacterium]
MTETRTSIPQTQTQLPPSDDPLADPLRLMKLTGVLHCHAEFTAPWGLAIPNIPGSLAIHIVQSGSFYLDIAGQSTLEVRAGSVVLIPHGTEHQLRSAPGVEATQLTDVPVQLITDRYERMNFGGGGDVTNISYCGVRYDPIAAKRLLQALPLVIHVDSLKQEHEWLLQTSRFITMEANATQPGSEAIVTRLADIVVVQIIRDWFANAEGQHGWLAALRDRQIGKALVTLHREPSRDWSVAMLAREVGMSRSALSARFSEFVGQSVMQYLTEWRMQLAREEIVETGQTVAAVAEKYGYHSEAAFSRAFKRIFGVSPGSARKMRSIAS